MEARRLGQYEGLILFIIQLENLAETYRRSFEDVLTGKEPRSEIVAYKISKLTICPGQTQSKIIIFITQMASLILWSLSILRLSMVRSISMLFTLITQYLEQPIARMILTQEQGFIETEAQIDVVTDQH